MSKNSPEITPEADDGAPEIAEIAEIEAELAQDEGASTEQAAEVAEDPDPVLAEDHDEALSADAELEESTDPADVADLDEAAADTDELDQVAIGADLDWSSLDALEGSATETVDGELEEDDLEELTHSSGPRQSVVIEREEVPHHEYVALAHQLQEELDTALADCAQLTRELERMARENTAVRTARERAKDRVSDLESTVRRMKDQMEEEVAAVREEYASYRRRMAREKERENENNTASVWKDLLDALDDVQRAREHEDLHGAFRSVGETLERVAAKQGVVAYGEAGEEFDPHLHEAVVSAGEDPESSVALLTQVFQVGYSMSTGRILRPVRGAVSTPKPGGKPAKPKLLTDERPADAGLEPEGPSSDESATPAENSDTGVGLGHEPDDSPQPASESSPTEGEPDSPDSDSAQSAEVEPDTASAEAPEAEGAAEEEAPETDESEPDEPDESATESDSGENEDSAGEAAEAAAEPADPDEADPDEADPDEADPDKADK